MSLWHTILTGYPAPPPIPNTRVGRQGLYEESTALGQLILGAQGTGKTTYLAESLFESWKQSPGTAIFVLDWSGSISNTLLTLIGMEPWAERERDLRRVVYDELGNREFMVPMPAFSPAYGEDIEVQINREKQSWERLASVLMQNVSLLGGVVYEGLVPAIFHVLTSMGETPWEMWQVSEVGEFVDDRTKLASAFRVYGAKIPQRVREILTRRVINVKSDEEELRTLSLLKIISAIESPYVLPRVGYNQPGYTVREAIDNGYLVLVNGQNLTGQDAVLHYLFTQIYSLFMAEVQLRDPFTRNYPPVKLVLDEVLTFLENPGMAEEIRKISPLYRSRKVQLYIAAQGLWQFDEKLKEAVWNLGNVVAFRILNHLEADITARQLMKYDPQTVKHEPKTELQNPTTEPHLGQYALYAQWLQRLDKRSCVIRKFINEQEQEPFLTYVPQTAEIRWRPLEEPLDSIKRRLLKERGKPVSELMAVINARTLPEKPKTEATSPRIQEQK